MLRYKTRQVGIIELILSFVSAANKVCLFVFFALIGDPINKSPFMHYSDSMTSACTHTSRGKNSGAPNCGPFRQGGKISSSHPSHSQTQTEQTVKNALSVFSARIRRQFSWESE
jgi:hypothetical protein